MKELKIVVIGVGFAGCNVVNLLQKEGMEDKARLVAISTWLQDLGELDIKHKLHLKAESTAPMVLDGNPVKDARKWSTRCSGEIQDLMLFSKDEMKGNTQ